MTDLKEKKYLVAFSFFEGIGPLRFRVLKKYFGSAKKIFAATASELEKVGLGKKLIKKFLKFREEFPLEEKIREWEKREIKIISEDEEIFPQSLLEIEGSPFLLYALGDLNLLRDNLKIAIVGTRKPTGYGREITKKLTSDLVEGGFTIVSGMAMGIDGIAHRTALEKGGRTIAVLGCGVDICYPVINKSLYKNLCQKGLILSEFPPGKLVTRGVFPARNRIVAGLSLGVLVTEGAHDSGSLITARYASDFGRDVFAVPGPITSQMSEATTFLLKEGAKPVSSVSDILEEYKIKYQKVKERKVLESFSDLTTEEKILLEKIKEKGKMQIDELVRETNLPAAQVSSLLSGLVIKGILKEIGMGEYCIII